MLRAGYLKLAAVYQVVTGDFNGDGG
jgi:hypothetical protein